MVIGSDGFELVAPQSLITDAAVYCDGHGEAGAASMP